MSAPAQVLDYLQAFPPDRTRTVTPAQVEALWERGDVSLREKTLWRLLYETCARANEVLALDIEDLDLPNKRASVLSKGGSRDWVFWQTGAAMCVALALTRGIIRRATDDLGNSWVDLTRCILRVLLPLAVVFGIILVALGVEQNLAGAQVHSTLTGGQQTLIGGPVGSWESIKLMSGGGGGFFNANSAHPFENPSSISNAIEILLMLLIPTAFIRTFGRMVGNLMLSWTLLGVVGALFAALLLTANAAQSTQTGTVPAAVGGPVEGTEVRFGVPASTLFGVAATGTADGAANSSCDSFSSIGSGTLIAAMMLGEIAPGGTGSGLYGLIIVVLLALFLGGLMIGRTPEFLGKRVTAKEMRYVALYSLVRPAAVLSFTALAMALPSARASMLNTGPHGFMEVLYAYTSNVNSNGSALAGLSGTPSSAT